jgi:hypothetical protein
MDNRDRDLDHGTSTMDNRTSTMDNKDRDLDHGQPAADYSPRLPRHCTARRLKVSPGLDPVAWPVLNQ